MEDKKPSESQAAPTAPKAPAHQASVTNGLAIAAMVVGIVSVLFGWAPFFGVLVGATAIVLAVIALKKQQNKGMSVTGLVTGIVGAVWSLIITLFFIIGLALLGGTAAVVGQAIDQQNQAVQDQADAKKDFAKGETARFGQFDVKVNSVKRDYVPENEFEQASSGKEIIVVNISVTNKGSESASFTNYDLGLSVNGISNQAYSFATVDDEFSGGTMEKGATATGNLVYEITKGETNLKLQYEDTAYDVKAGEIKTFTYTLAI